MKGLRMAENLRSAVAVFVAFTVLTGVVYPLVILAVGQGLLRSRAGGSLVYVDGRPVGSALIGQRFTEDRYFHPRPSVVDYDAGRSGATNLAPTNKTLIRDVEERLRTLESKGSDVDRVPVDLVTSSGSGLDPDISPAAAFAQAGRIAEARGISVAEVRAVVEDQIIERQLGFLGERRVNVLSLNIELDKRFSQK